MEKGTPSTINQTVVPDFTIKVRKSRNESDGCLEFGIKEIDEPTYIAAQTLIRNDKELEAVRFLLKNLRVSGNTVDELTFQATRAAVRPMFEFLSPLDGELKKN